MTRAPRSGCAINAAVEVLGDPWAMLVLRDIVFGNRRYFRELLAGSEEGIASNILASRLKRLVEAGLLTRDEAHRGQRAAYSLTEAGIQVLPVMVALGNWGLAHRDGERRLRVRAELLRDGGPGLVDALMDELRELHLGIPRPDPDAPRPSEQLAAAYERAVGGAETGSEETITTHPAPGVTIRRTRGPDEYPRLVAVWRTAVDATHDFLSVAHRDAIETRLASDYFPQVGLVVAERDGVVVGFAGTAGDRLEMLFVDDAERGRGIGTALLEHVVGLGVTAVDVNEQNPQAVAFYRRRGFDVVGRSALDDDGRPYPLLHLARRSAQ
ncbi:acetyltransferase [Luteimicrobium sp. NPDC057192]|uniref:acetyltransferase n=1 Tax=Luteimicrobium sp. NPDC057192 TaxID=3346042 RepID=UPI00363EA1CB